MATLDEHEAFQAMSVFLARCTVDEVSLLLGELALEPEGTTGDPAAWGLWLKCIRDVQAGMVPGAPLEAAPEVVKALGVSLEQAGFERVAERRADLAAGGGRVEWSRRGMHVRALRDRLDWSIWIGADGQLRWYSVSVWEEFLLRGRLPIEDSRLSLSEQCEHAAALAPVLPEVDDPKTLRLAMQTLGTIPVGYAWPQRGSAWTR